MHLFLALVAFRALEIAGGARAVGGGFRHEIYRMLTHISLFAIPAVLLARPMSALILSVAALCGLAIANSVKKQAVYEPIVFSDLALIGQIIRYPQLYFLNRFRLAAMGLAAGGGIAILCILESPRLSTLWLAVPLIFFIAMNWFARHALASWFSRFCFAKGSGWGSLDIGLPSALILQWLGWLSQPAVSAPTRPAGAFRTDTDLVVIQLESFFDSARSLGSPRMFWRDLQERAVQAGALQVQVRGANTMRTEHAILSGLPDSAIAFARFDPYLRLPASLGLPAILAQHGWRTTFIHPNDAAFFRRNRALPALGFETLRTGAEFEGAERVGPYVSDRAVFDKILTQLEHTGAPQLVFAVTMENHGPWKHGRIPGVAAGLASYNFHMDNLGASLQTLVRRLEERDRNTLVVLYGDHLPALAELGAIPDPHTDYVVLDIKTSRAQPAVIDLPPELLLETVGELLKPDKTVASHTVLAV